MKSAALVLAGLLGLVAPAAMAGESFSLSCDPPVRVADRYRAGEEDFAITTESRKVVLLMTDRVVALQLSDRVLDKLSRKMKDERDENDNVLGHAFKSAVLTGVHSMLSHSAECPIREIARADYRDGELILESKSGKRIFGEPDIDDDNVMTSFAPADAKLFVRELRKRMAKSH